MRLMNNLLLTRIFVCVLVGCMGLFLLGPLGAQAKVEVGLDDGGGGEGDPLDSNDYGSGGGGGGSDSDIHDTLATTPDDGILDLFRILFMDESGALVLPFFQNGVPVFQVIFISDGGSAAVTHAD